MRVLGLLAVLVAAALAGCVDAGETTDIDIDPTGLAGLPDTAQRLSLAPHPAYGFPTYTDYTGLSLSEIPEAWIPPAPREIPENPVGLEHLATTPDVSGASGIAVFGHYVFSSGGGGTITDISDPANPVMVANLDTSIRDMDLIAHPDGRITLVAAIGGAGIALWDATDPTDPIPLEPISVGSHNAAVVPGTPIVYNAGSEGGAGGLVPTNPGAWVGQGNGDTEIYDLTDPENPVQLTTFENGFGCHDITFFIDAANDKYRAYCAGIEMTQIWDIADPLNPVLLTDIPVHHGVAGTPSGSVPLVLFSHLAMVSADGSILIVGDETGGGAAPGCDAYVDAAGNTVSGPLGNLWFYDISDESNPELLSWFSPNNPATQVAPVGEAQPIFNCTAHFGRLIEDRDQLVMAFYQAGTVLLDFSDPTHPVIVDQFQNGRAIWDSWEWQGYVFNGVDVLTIV